MSVSEWWSLLLYPECVKKKINTDTNSQTWNNYLTTDKYFFRARIEHTAPMAVTLWYFLRKNINFVAIKSWSSTSTCAMSPGAVPPGESIFIIRAHLCSFDNRCVLVVKCDALWLFSEAIGMFFMKIFLINLFGSHSSNLCRYFENK